MAKVLSIQDKNLGVSTINTTRTKLYSDIDLTFVPRPSGDIYKKKDAAAVKQAVINLILTNHYEKPFLPKFGGNIRSMLFELADEETSEDIKQNIRAAIGRYEPRAQVLNISSKVNLSANSISVGVEFRVTNTEEIVTFTTVLSRLR